MLAEVRGRDRVGRAVPLTSKQRSELRAEAHHLSPTVHVGQHGITTSLVESLDDALRARELVKIQLGRHAELDPREMANHLAAEASADVVQVIGKTATLYRENPELERRVGKAPPWRRWGGGGAGGHPGPTRLGGGG
jgi:RNA-binding protein